MELKPDSEGLAAKQLDLFILYCTLLSQLSIAQDQQQTVLPGSTKMVHATRAFSRTSAGRVHLLPST